MGCPKNAWSDSIDKGHKRMVAFHQSFSELSSPGDGGRMTLQARIIFTQAGLAAHLRDDGGASTGNAA
jgi:hypothetical protein